MNVRVFICWAASLFLAMANRAEGVILWSDLGDTRVRDNFPGTDILGGAVKETDASTNTLYFKFHVDPWSDSRTELYEAAFQLCEGDTERLAVGNSLKAWAYSAFHTSEVGASNNELGDVDLHSSSPDVSGLGTFFTYELPRRGVGCTIAFKVEFVAGADDKVTVWLNPNLGASAAEADQPESLTTRFRANASFDQIRLTHQGKGDGWTFGDMAIATSFADLAPHSISLTFRAWQREQGLPQNTVRALAQTRDGYIWVGTDDGLARFDGARFVSFGPREGLRSGPVSTLLEDSAGTLWIGTTGGGLSRRQGGKFRTWTERDGLPSDAITALTEDGAGRIWIGTEEGLTRWPRAGKGVNRGETQFAGKAVTTLFRDQQNAVWMGVAGEGVFYFTNETFTPVRDGSVNEWLNDPHCLLVDHAGRLWVGAGDDRALCREGTQWRSYRITRHLARPYVSALAETPDGTVWAGSVSEGLFGVKDGEWIPPRISSGLSDNSALAMLVDREGDLWVGTGGGLDRLRRGDLLALGQDDGLGYGAAQGLAEVSPGVVWAAKPSDGIFRLTTNGITRVNSPLLARFPQVNSLWKAQDGSCWVATSHGVLHFHDPAAPENETEPPALPALNILSLAQGRDGTMWAGAREGELWRLASGGWERQTNFPRAQAITALAETREGSLWIGCEGSGVFEYRGGVLAHLDKSKGLSSDVVRALYADGDGTLWIGTAGGGLNCWRNGRVSVFGAHEGLPDNTISQIVDDGGGRLWLGCNWGIACVGKDEMARLSAGLTPAVYPQVYGRAEGMISEECTGGFCPAGLKTEAGKLWFSTSKGVVVADPHPMKADQPAPATLLEEMLVDGAPDAIGEGTRLEPGKHRLEFHYTGLSFAAPERVRFRYRLEGLDSDWIEAGINRTASYPYVPAGNYRFHVIACNGDGVWNETGASVAFTVLQHFWKQWWFLSLAAVGLLVSGGGAVRAVEKHQMQRRVEDLERERAVERERSRIAQDLHDDLGSSLTRISLLSGLAREDRDNLEQVEAHVNKISQSAAQTLRALEEIVWALRPGSDTLQSLADYIAHFANELFEEDRLRCRLDLPADLPPLALPPEMRHNIFLIVKEALTNALKHSAASEALVQAKVAEGTLEIVVRDNGRGLEPAGRGGKGNGLGNMRRRAEAMHGTLAVESGDGRGTTVRLTVRLPVPAVTGNGAKN